MIEEIKRKLSEYLIQPSEKSEKLICELGIGKEFQDKSPEYIQFLLDRIKVLERELHLLEAANFSNEKAAYKGFGD